jgi:hypothetical protein
LVQVLQPEHHQTLEVQYQNLRRPAPEFVLPDYKPAVVPEVVSKSVEAVGLLVKE